MGARLIGTGNDVLVTPCWLPFGIGIFTTKSFGMIRVAGIVVSLTVNWLQTPQCRSETEGDDDKPDTDREI